jgi:hypothetical protein
MHAIPFLHNRFVTKAIKIVCIFLVKLSCDEQEFALAVKIKTQPNLHFLKILRGFDEQERSFIEFLNCVAANLAVTSEGCFFVLFLQETELY